MGDGYGQIIQGHLESSNAVIADELVKLHAGTTGLLVHHVYYSQPEMSKRPVAEVYYLKAEIETNASKQCNRHLIGADFQYLLYYFRGRITENL